MTYPVSFGTSGHRGVVGEAFSLNHVRAISLAIASFVLSQRQNPKVVIGYDPRQGNSPDLSEGSFTRLIVDTLTDQGVNVDFYDSFSPTPLISWYVRRYAMDGGIILTASHNPPQYNGIKFNPSNGAPAPSQVTEILQKKANAYYTGAEQPVPAAVKGTYRFVNTDAEFAQDLIVGLRTHAALPTLDFSNTSVVVDIKHGAAGAIWRELFAALGIKRFELISEEPRADFGGMDPNPTKQVTLSKLRERQQALKAPLALANDPDADRHVILDEAGANVTPEQIAVIILDYFISKKVAMKGISTTVASSAIIKNAVLANHLAFDETAVGFKNFTPFLEEAEAQNVVAFGVESSGGFTASFHVYEKCGFLPGIILLHLLKETGLPLSQLKAKVEAKYGSFTFLEEEFKFSDEKKAELLQLISTIDVNEIESKLDLKSVSINRLDGLKVVVSSGWFLVRFSGTEPLARLYAEAQDFETAKGFVERAKRLLA